VPGTRQSLEPQPHSAQLCRVPALGKPEIFAVFSDFCCFSLNSQ